jgi:hypothetical protein
MLSSICKAQENKLSYLTIGTGLLWDNYGSMGPRLHVEYVRRIADKEKLFWGISSDNKWKGLSGIPSFKLQQGVPYPPELNFNQLNLSIHSLSRMGKSILMFDFSLGAGAIYLNGEGKHSVQTSISFGMSMNIRLSKKTFLETTPLFIFPPSKISFSSHKVYPHFKSYTTAAFLPIGLKFKL